MPRASLIAVALLLSGCVPDLSPWRVVSLRPDGAPDRLDAGPRFDGQASADGSVGRDGAGPGRDAQPPPLDPCESPTPLGASYFEDFEDGPSGWYIGGESPSWEIGTPAGEVVAGAFSGTQAWATGLDRPYNDQEESFVQSPCIDASSAADDLLLTLARAYATEPSYDRGLVEYSVDGGESWELATGTSRLGFYSTSTGWNGTGGWESAATILEGTAGQSRVLIRVRFHSDRSAAVESFAFDDVSLRPASHDLALTLTEAPRCGHSVATVTNVGGRDVTGFEIAWTVDGVGDTTPFDSTLRYLETATLEIGGPLAGRATAAVFAVSDTNDANDAASIELVTTPLGSGYFSDFEADGGDLVSYGDRSSWQWGAPTAPLIRAAASGSRAWVTNLEGDYNPSEQSYLQSPCFDFSAATRDPQLSFYLIYRTETTHDRAWVEVSVDGGSFSRLGSPTSGGVTWYDRYDGWQGTSGGEAWYLAQHPLTDTWGHQAVRFRFAFRSDGNTQFEGFGLDDLAINP